MTKSESLLILGVHLKSEGYPNVKYRIEDLKKAYPCSDEFNFPMWSESDLGKPGRYSMLKSGGRVLWAHLLVMSKFVLGGKKNVVYVPYPSIFICFILSFLPSVVRPKKLIIDAFISIYDTVVCDRKMLLKDGFSAKILRGVERRAFSVADVIVTDTALNGEYYSRLFDLDSSKFLAIPLSTNEFDYCYAPYTPSGNGVCRVLFVGTLIPLHGIQTILHAIELLRCDKKIQFTIIGNGQDGKYVKEYIDRYPKHIKWVSTWQGATQITNYINDSDVCLGVFGQGDKTQRVCPYKLYHYMVCGRAIITADTDWTRPACQGNRAAPFEMVQAGDGGCLAKKIKELAENEDKRRALASASSLFYKNNLSNKMALTALTEIFGFKKS